MSDQTLISYAQNAEDVVLWRALRSVEAGRYVDVGACDPVELSVTKALYDRGWRGIDIDAVPEYADRLRRARPGNEVVHAAITDRPVATATFHQIIDTGLSTLVDDTAAAHEDAGFRRRDITVPVMTLDAVCERSELLGGDLHLLKVDVEGAEGEVLRSFDLARWRPWVVVVEATVPLSDEPSYADWEPVLLAAGYTFTLFDGISRFYVSPEHPELVKPLAYPACSLDDFVTARQHTLDVATDELRRELAAARQEADRWRNQAVGYWANAVARVQTSEDEVNKAKRDVARLRRQLAGVRERLQQVRADRGRLRDRVRRLDARLAELQDKGAGTQGSRGRLQSAIKKVTGA